MSSPTTPPVQCVAANGCFLDDGSGLGIPDSHSYDTVVCGKGNSRHPKASSFIHATEAKKIPNELFDFALVPSGADAGDTFEYRGGRWQRTQGYSYDIGEMDGVLPYCGRPACLVDVFERYGNASVRQILETSRQDPAQARLRLEALRLNDEAKSLVDAAINQIENPSRSKGLRKSAAVNNEKPSLFGQTPSRWFLISTVVVLVLVVILRVFA